MATAEQIDKINQAYGGPLQRAPAGTYKVEGVSVEYGGPGTQPTEETSTVDRKKTPESWDGPEDARSKQGAGTYPNYYVHKTRSGHVFMMDDSEGAEHLTIQHRTGTMIQVGPDGVLNITANKGQYNIIFGENRIMVTGAQDITVQGDASLRVDGDYNVNASGKINFNAQSDINFSALNVNTVARGNLDIQAKNRTEKIEGQIMQTAEGAQTIMAGTGMTLGAKLGGVAMMAGTMMSLVSKAALMLRAFGAIGVKAEGTVGVESTGAVSVLAGGALTMSGVGTSAISAAGPLSLYGTPINQNLTPTVAPPALDGVATFTHIPAPPAMPDPTSLTDIVST